MVNPDLFQLKRRRVGKGYGRPESNLEPLCVQSLRLESNSGSPTPSHWRPPHHSRGPEAPQPSIAASAPARGAPRPSPPHVTPPPPGVPGPHLSRRRPRLPATSASLLHPRPSGARSKLPLSLRSSGSGRRLRVAPAAAGSGGPEGAAVGGDEVRGGGACSSSPHSDRSRAGDPKPAAAPAGRIARLPLAAALRRQGRKDEAEGAERSSEEEAPLPAPLRPVCLREPDEPAAPAAPGAGPPTARVRAPPLPSAPPPCTASSAPSPRRRALQTPGRWSRGWAGRAGPWQVEEEAAEEPRLGGSTTTGKPAA